jgi:flagellar hook-basal body complex protein FliE
MLNPFLNTNKTAIILSYSSNASDKAYSLRKQTERTRKEDNFFQLLNKEFNKVKESQVKKTFELVA